MAQFRAADPYNLGKILQERPDIETIVVDSITALSYIALQEAVARAGGSKISIEQPGMQGYTYRNALMLRITVAIMRLCSLRSQKVGCALGRAQPKDKNRTQFLYTQHH
jgi:hypothetical protein